MRDQQRTIEVFAHWKGLPNPAKLGTLFATPSRGKEIFSFEYDDNWLKQGFAQRLDPSLGLYGGRQYAPEGQSNFGAFLDSSPDRWGRLLMRRREAQLARVQSRPEQALWESDYLLGVYDGHRPGALRFRFPPDGPFLDNTKELASPPWARLRDLEHASLQLEREDAETDHEYSNWLRLLLVPGASLGGARPKASVLDEQGSLWIAKFPSRLDEFDVGAWEHLVNNLADKAGIEITPSQCRTFSVKRHTFLSRRFDRTVAGERIHFASAMTLLQRNDGDDATVGASYLELAEFVMQQGARPERDLEQLWRRIVFFMCVSNTDDHLRNHGFLLTSTGWNLSPVYDVNPAPHSPDGLKLNVSETDNSQDLELARSVAKYFRIKPARAEEILLEVIEAVRTWRQEAKKLQIPDAETERMARAFRLIEKP
ncbi:HipA domain-containing protein [bacterium]|nr:HipA domain-containing protein [bacterium]